MMSGAEDKNLDQIRLLLHDHCRNGLPQGSDFAWEAGLAVLDSVAVGLIVEYVTMGGMLTYPQHQALEAHARELDKLWATPIDPDERQYLGRLRRIMSLIVE